MPPPPWMHKDLKKEVAEGLLTDAGLDSGRFLVRTRKGKVGEYILSVVYKGKPTHHPISKNEDGKYTINKKLLGEHDRVASLIKYLGQNVPGWPVPLDKPVHRAGADGIAASAAAPKATPEAAPKAAPPEAAPPADTHPIDIEDVDLWYNHGEIKKGEADKLLMADGGKAKPGKFLIRKKADSYNDFILGVVFKGKATHHTVNRPSPGEEFTINKNVTGQDTIAGLVKFLRKSSPKWPVPLTDAVLRDGVRVDVDGCSCSGTLRFYGVHDGALHCGVELDEAVGDGDGTPYFTCDAGKGLLISEAVPATLVVPAGSRPRRDAPDAPPAGAGADKTLAKLVAPTKPSEPTKPSPKVIKKADPVPAAPVLTANSAAAVIAVPAGGMPWLHGAIKKSEAEALLEGKTKTGVFLVRKHITKPEHYVVSVVYKGKPTHHLLSAPSNAGSVINKNESGVTGLAATIAAMRQKSTWWPVPLKDHIEGSGDAGPAGAAVPAEPKQAAAPTPEPEPRVPATEPAPVTNAPAVTAAVPPEPEPELAATPRPASALAAKPTAEPVPITAAVEPEVAPVAPESKPSPAAGNAAESTYGHGSTSGEGIQRHMSFTNTTSFSPPPEEAGLSSAGPEASSSAAGASQAHRPSAHVNPNYAPVAPSQLRKEDFAVEPVVGKNGELVLKVAYQGRSLDHLVGKTADGLLAIDKEVADREIYSGFDEIDLDNLPNDGPNLRDYSGHAIDGPAWLHPLSNTQEDRERKLLVGGMEDGTFLVEQREGAPVPEFVLSLMFRGSPMTYMIQRGNQGFLTINGQPFGQFSTITDLIGALKETVPPQWPTRLVRGVKRPGMPMGANQYQAQMDRTQAQWDKDVPSPRRAYIAAEVDARAAEQENLRRLIFMTTPSTPGSGPSPGLQQHPNEQAHVRAMQQGMGSPMPNFAGVRSGGLTGRKTLIPNTIVPRRSLSPEHGHTWRVAPVASTGGAAAAAGYPGTRGLLNPYIQVHPHSPFDQQGPVGMHTGYQATRSSAQHVLGSQIELLRREAQQGQLNLVNARAQGYSTRQLQKQITDLHRLNRHILQLQSNFNQLRVGDYWGNATMA